MMLVMTRRDAENPVTHTQLILVTTGTLATVTVRFVIE